MDIITKKNIQMKLSKEGISEAVGAVDEYLLANSVDTKSRLHYKFLLEDLLLEYMEEEKDAHFTIDFKRLWRLITITVSIDGKSINLMEKYQDSSMARYLLKNSQTLPLWKYISGKNVFSFFIKPNLPKDGNLRFVLSYLTRDNKALILAALLRFIDMGLCVLEPILSAWIIVAYSSSHIKKIVIIAALILGQSAVSSLIDWVSGRLLRRSYANIIKSLQNTMTENVLKIKTECMDKQSNGVFIQRLTDETERFTDAIDNILDNATMIFSLISLLIAFAIISVKMFFFELILFIIYFLIKNGQSKIVTDGSRQCRIAGERHAGFVGEMVKAHRDIKLLHCEDSFMDKLNESVEHSVDMTTKVRTMSMNFILLRSQFIAWSNFLYMSVLALLMAKDGMPPETALALFNYNGRVYSSAVALSSFMDNIYDFHLSTERIYQLIEGKDYEKEVFGTDHLDQVHGDIALEDVWFSYEHTDGRKVQVLKGLDLKINAGETVAFVGRSGCGKSTILSLITRLFDPEKGRILLDGHDVAGLDQDSLRGNISMVSQMPYIFNMSIKENLAIARKDLKDEDMIKACKAACIHDDIMEFPNGYDTVVGEGGVTLSGGQRQRVALARGLLRDDPVIILDEATSALDNLTQSKIKTAIDNLSGTRTIIMVAHRLTTVINSDRLYFISDGKVLAEGSHKELLENCEEYRQLYGEETA